MTCTPVSLSLFLCALSDLAVGPGEGRDAGMMKRVPSPLLISPATPPSSHHPHSIDRFDPPAAPPPRLLCLSPCINFIHHQTRWWTSRRRWRVHCTTWAASLPACMWTHPTTSSSLARMTQRSTSAGYVCMCLSTRQGMLYLPVHPTYLCTSPIYHLRIATILALAHAGSDHAPGGSHDRGPFDDVVMVLVTTGREATR